MRQRTRMLVTILVRRQSVSFSFRIGPNDETILVINGEDIVYLTGNNAMCFEIFSTESILYANGFLLLNPFRGIGPFADIEMLRVLGETGGDIQVFTMSTGGFERGPGTLFVSDLLAFFTNNPIADEITAAKATARPVTAIQVVVEPIPGQEMSRLNVNNEEFLMVLTGSPTRILGIPIDNRILYSDTTLRVEQGLLQSTEYPDITTFAVLRLVPGTSEVQFNISSTETTEVLLGPGQVYVSPSENKAFYVEDFLFLIGERDVIGTINSQIFTQAFSLEDLEGEVVVRDRVNTELVTLSRNASKLGLPDAAEVTFNEPENKVMFRDRGGRITTLYGIQMFSLFDDNVVVRPASGTTVPLSTGGTIFIDDLKMMAFFSSDSNPVVVEELCNAIPVIEGISYAYDVTEDSEGKRLLIVERRNITTTLAIDSEPTAVQTVTGLYVTAVREGESITFMNNEIIIKDFFDNAVQRIGGVDTLAVNTETIPFQSFQDASPIPFQGPGTLSYSRGTAFYTNDRNLGRDLSFQSRTAPIPDIDYMQVPLRINTIDGINYTESSLVQTIGGDRVITYEATSYTTSQDQEVLYSGGIITVSPLCQVGDGNISYSSSSRTVTYIDTNGDVQMITDVSTFNEFSGGDIMTTIPPNDRTVRGPGKLYVSEDGSEVLFSTSNIITPEVADIIRRGEIAFSVPADQLSSINFRIFNISTDSATVTYPGGGVILSNNGTRESFYVNDDLALNQIRRDVSVFFTVTKSLPAKDLGIIGMIFNGRSVYSYFPIASNNDIPVRRTDFFVFNDTTITGLSLGPFTGINRLITYDGLEVKSFNSSDTAIRFDGYGLLLVQTNSDTAFYTTLVSNINYLLQSIKILEDTLIPPQIEPRRGDSQVTTKKREDVFQFGTNVKAFAGSSITFTCNTIRGNPEPIITFCRILEDGNCTTLNDSQVGITIVNSSLTIDSISTADAGGYKCTAYNGIPPPAEAISNLNVREATAPRIRPGWFPFFLRPGQSIVWPSDPPQNATIEVQAINELVVACRVDGRPKAEVTWLFNGVDIQSALNSSVNITEIIQGRSVAIISVEALRDVLRGENTIVCQAENLGGSTTGTITVQGIFYTCTVVGAGDCSRTCGVGIRRINYACSREQAGMATQSVSESTVPDNVLSSGRTEVCIVFDSEGDRVICPLTEYRWNTSEWTECTRSCGGGSRNRTVTCLNVSIPITSDYRPDLDSIVETEAELMMCDMFAAAGEIPTSRELCNTQDCPIWLAAEEFSKCSVTCGTGIEEREVTCNIISGNYTDEYGNFQFNFTVVNSSLCDSGKQPNAARVCRMIRCRYEWLPQPFGECGDVPLPDEFPFCKQRSFVCYNDDPNPFIRDSDRIINDSFCADVKPIVSSLGSCSSGRCFNGIWNTSKWTTCSKTCGYGVQTRELGCLSPSSRIPVPLDYCDVGTIPPSKQRCFLRNCEDTCLQDESVLCPIFEIIGMCDSSLAMGNNGLRCCDTCLGLRDEDYEYLYSSDC